MKTSERIATLEHAYRLFNDRRVDELLAMMTDDVEWPDVANGTTLPDKGAIRRYWSDQFAAARPQVTPTGFIEVGEDLVAVIDRRIEDLHGSPLVPPAVVFHRYTFAGNLVSRMVVFPDREAALAGGRAARPGPPATGGPARVAPTNDSRPGR